MYFALNMENYLGKQAKLMFVFFFIFFNLYFVNIVFNYSYLVGIYEGSSFFITSVQLIKNYVAAQESEEI